jgi:hypothetical protein
MATRRISLWIVFVFCSLLWSMPVLSPLQVLDIISKRMEVRVRALQRVGLPGMEPTIHEIGKYAAMIRKAMAYLHKQ